MKGLHKVWLLGDDFLAETYRKSFKKSSHDFYLKSSFEVLPFGSTRRNDKNANAVSRIVNSFIQALNTKYYLPDYLIVFLDVDLVDYLQYKKFKVASLLGPWIEYLSEVFAESLQKRRMQLPKKARLEECTQVYWVEPVNHNNFDYTNQQIREKLAGCLDANSKNCPGDAVRTLKLRDYWDKADDNLVYNDRFTRAGLAAYWKSLDASFQFNVCKRNDFIIRNRFRALKTKSDEKPARHGQTMKSGQEDTADKDEMQQFFNRN